MTPEHAANLRKMLDRAVEESKKHACNQKPPRRTPILNAAIGLPSELLGIPVVVEAGKG